VNANRYHKFSIFDAAKQIFELTMRKEMVQKNGQHKFRNKRGNSYRKKNEEVSG
jgi:hypothetical protein